MVGGMVGKNDFAIRLIIYDVRSSWVRFLPEGNIVSTNLFFLESFEQISMYIEYGTPSCVSGGGGTVGYLSGEIKNTWGGVDYT